VCKNVRTLRILAKSWEMTDLTVLGMIQSLIIAVKHSKMWTCNENYIRLKGWMLRYNLNWSWNSLYVLCRDTDYSSPI